MKKKTVSKSRARSAPRRKDDNSFIIIVGGGFIIISLVLFFSGLLPSSISLLNVTPRDKNTLGVETQQVLKMVTIKGDSFTPGKLLITKGTKVVFTNSDNLQVENAVSDGGMFDTGPLGVGDSKTVEFPRGGIYPYHNANNPRMTGVILVLQ